MINMMQKIAFLLLGAAVLEAAVIVRRNAPVQGSLTGGNPNDLVQFNHSIHTENKTALEAVKACKAEGAKLALLLNYESIGYINAFLTDPDYVATQALLEAQALNSSGEPSSWGGWCKTAAGDYIDINEDQGTPEVCRYAQVMSKVVDGFVFTRMRIGWDNATNKRYYICYTEKPVDQSQLENHDEVNAIGSNPTGGLTSPHGTIGGTGGSGPKDSPVPTHGTTPGVQAPTGGRDNKGGAKTTAA